MENVVEKKDETHLQRYASQRARRQIQPPPIQTSNLSSEWLESGEREEFADGLTVFRPGRKELLKLEDLWIGLFGGGFGSILAASAEV